MCGAVCKPDLQHALAKLHQVVQHKAISHLRAEERTEQNEFRCRAQKPRQVDMQRNVGKYSFELVQYAHKYMHHTLGRPQ